MWQEIHQGKCETNVLLFTSISYERKHVSDLSMLVFCFRGHMFVVYLRTTKFHNNSVFKDSLYTFYSRKPTCGIPPCLRISNRKYPPCPQNSIIVNPPSPSEIQKAVRGIVWIFSGIAHYRMLMSIAWWDETRKILETTTNWVLSSRNKHFLHLPLEWILRHDLFLKKNKNNHSQTQQMAKPRALACTCPYAKLIKKDHRKVFYLKVWYFCLKSNFWTIKTVCILVKVCIYVLYTRQCQGYCPMGAWSPEAPTIYLWATKIWNKRPERVHENHDPQDNFH